MHYIIETKWFMNSSIWPEANLFSVKCLYYWPDKCAVIITALLMILFYFLQVRRTSGAQYVESLSLRKLMWNLIWLYTLVPRTLNVTIVTRCLWGNKISSSTCIHIHCKAIFQILFKVYIFNIPLNEWYPLLFYILYLKCIIIFYIYIFYVTWNVTNNGKLY